MKKQTPLLCKEELPEYLSKERDATVKETVSTTQKKKAKKCIWDHCDDRTTLHQL